MRLGRQALGLHDALLDHSCKISRIEVRLGTSVSSLHEDGPVVRAVFDDGSSGDFDLAVGAEACARLRQPAGRAP